MSRSTHGECDVDPSEVVWNKPTPSQQEWDETVPYDFRSASLRHFDVSLQNEVLGWVGDLANKFDDPVARGQNLLFTGPIGCGKTHAGFATAKYLRFRGYASWDGYLMRLPTRYWPMAEVIADLRRDENQRTHTTMQFITGSPIVFLDDVGSMRQTDWVMDQMFRILDARRAQCRPVVATTNLPNAQLQDYLGEAAYSRLAQGAVVVQMTGRDKREDSE